MHVLSIVFELAGPQLPPTVRPWFRFCSARLHCEVSIGFALGVSSGADFDAAKQLSYMLRCPDLPALATKERDAQKEVRSLIETACETVF